MGEVKLARIDFRLMHGQVVTAWLQQSGADAILIVDDELATNKFMAQVFLMAKPQGVKVSIKTVDRTVEGFRSGAFNQLNLLILFKSVETAMRAFEKGMPLKKLQIGGLGSGTDKAMISKEIALSLKEARMLEEMAGKGVEISLQMTPRDARISLDDALKIVHEKLNA